MKDSWRHFIRRIAATSVIVGSTAWSSAMCYAVTLAFDSASDPVYLDGWQGSNTAGDNGGFGFGPWNFDGTYNSVPQQAIDDGAMNGTQTSSPHNQVGRAWTMYNPVGRANGTPNNPAGTDIARAGRALNTPLQVGQTLTVILDNPTEEVFFRGYIVKLNSVGENLCFGTGPDNSGGCTSHTIYPRGDYKINNKVDAADYTVWRDTLGSTTDLRANGDKNGASANVIDMADFNFWKSHFGEGSPVKFNVGQFAYDFPFGRWYDSSVVVGLNDVDTDAGVQIDIKLTSVTTYEMTMTPLDNTMAAVMTSGELDDAVDINPINWIEFQFFNTDSDFYPSLACDPTMPGCVFGTAVGNIRATDFYIRSLEIRGPAMPGSGSSSGLGGGTIPEPSTFVYLVAGVLGFASFRYWKVGDHGAGEKRGQ